MPAAVPTPDEVLTELRKITASASFTVKPHLCRFLEFITDEALAGHESEIKQTTIADAVYRTDRNQGSELEPKVRNAAAELRKRLAAYYAAEGASDPVTINIPIGTYVPQFAHSEARRLHRERRGRSWELAVPVVGIMLLVVVCLGVGVFRWSKPRSKGVHEFGSLYADAYDAFDHSQNARAIALMDRAIDRNPGNADFWHLRGMCYRRLRKIDPALRDLTMSIRLRPGYPYSYYERGAAFNALGRHDDAIQDLDTAIKIGGSEAKSDLFYQERGTAHYKLRSGPESASHLEQALQDFDEAARRNPKNGWAFAARGALYLHRKQFCEAGRDFDRAQTLLPPDRWVLNDSAAAWDGCGDLARAARYRERAKNLPE